MKYLSSTLLISIFYLFTNPFLYSQERGIIYGIVADGGLKTPLGFANIGISQLGIGTTTDLDGKYRLTNVPAGQHELRISYLGYEDQLLSVVVVGGQEVEVNGVLNEAGVALDEVVVTGQATGQKAAINQQVNSNTIVNVVSREKLQELPDQNAAEAVGRLAGVTLYRDGGEGQQVAIRGISPRFNSITINGERLASTDEQTRSVDLSMISPDMLGGIELFKAIRPDMDGDAIGGTVNFSVKKADAGASLNIRALKSYNGLKDKLGDLSRANLFYSTRFAEDKFGIVLSGNFQRADRSSEALSASYEFSGRDASDRLLYQIAGLNLADVLETRDRYGGGLTFDFSPNAKHALIFNGTYGKTDRDDIRYRRRYRVSQNAQEFDIRRRERSTALYAASLKGEHAMGNIKIDWQTSYGRSDQQTPFSLTGRFQELAATNNAVTGFDLGAVAESFGHELERTIFYNSIYQPTSVEEERFTAKVDLQYDFSFSNTFNGKIKIGGKYRRVDRERDVTSFLIRPYLIGDNPADNDPLAFITSPSKQILMANFLGDYTNSAFFDGDYDLLPGTPDIRSRFTTAASGIDIARYNSLFGTNYQEGDPIPYQGHLDMAKVERFFNAYRGDYFRNIEEDRQDYFGGDQVSAAYAMTELNITKRLMFLGGVRLEETQQDYTAVITGNVEEGQEDLPGNKTFINAGRSYLDVLPMAHLRYKFTEWMDVRAAVTKTLARPNFFNIVPWEVINSSEQQIQRGNPNLLQTNAWNYDLFLSFYNKFGLFTVGGFYKELFDLDYVGNYVVLDADAPTLGFLVFEPLNATTPSTVRGVEIDFQANLSSLSGFWSGLVFSGNLTLARSSTLYPFFEVNQVTNPIYDRNSPEYDPRFDPGSPSFDPTAEFPPFTIFSTQEIQREGPVVGQANLLANFTLGYEKGGFSGRISMNYQSDALSPGRSGVGNTDSGVGKVPEEDTFDQEFVRMDLALKQDLDKKGRFKLMLNINNITNTPERSYIGPSRFRNEEEFYGMTADIGIQFRIRK